MFSNTKPLQFKREFIIWIKFEFWRFLEDPLPPKSSWNLYKLWSRVNKLVWNRICLKGFWRWCMLYRAIGLVLDFIHRLVCGRQKIPQRFGYWICLRLQVDGAGQTYSVGPVRKS
jgi:hypothetical protein